MKEIYQEFIKGMKPVGELITKKLGGKGKVKILLAIIATLLVGAIVLCSTMCTWSCRSWEKHDSESIESGEIQETEPSGSDEIPEQTIAKMNLGETVSTDLAEFTLENCTFTYYVSNSHSNYVEPTDEPNSLYAASIGHCYVSATFTITNKDRGGSLSFAGSFSEWNPNWTVSYNGTSYPVKGFDLNNNAGTYTLNLHHSAVVDKETGEVINIHDSMNYLLRAGDSVTLRAFGVIDAEPENLTDGFDFSVDVLNSDGVHERFTYTVPARQ